MCALGCIGETGGIPFSNIGEALKLASESAAQWKKRAYIFEVPGSEELEYSDLAKVRNRREYQDKSQGPGETNEGYFAGRGGSSGEKGIRKTHLADERFLGLRDTEEVRFFSLVACCT